MTPIDPQLILTACGKTLPGEVVPGELLPLMISSILCCASAKNLIEVLEKEKPEYARSTTTVGRWLRDTTEWLGAPKPQKGKTSSNHKQAIRDWYVANGSPTLEEIRGGWVPKHRRSHKTGTISDPAPTANPVNAPINPPVPAPNNPPSAPAKRPEKRGKTPAQLKNEQEAAELEALANETRKMGTTGVPLKTSPQEPKLPVFVGPTPPSVHCTDEVEKGQFAKLLQVALEAYTAEITAMGYEILEPYNGFGSIKVRKKAETAS